MTVPRAVEIVVGDEPARWAALGFAVEAGATTVGEVRIALEGGSAGLRAVRVRGLRSDRPDGLALVAGDAEVAPGCHANGATAVDHVVALTDDQARTSAALEAAGLPLRRVREAGEARQAFHLAGTLVLEVVQAPGTARPALWGLVVVVADLDAAAARLGDAVGPIADAVQPGRRIATARREAGLSVPLALMTPR